jgi:DNA mismatch repair protein MutS2
MRVSAELDDLEPSLTPATRHSGSARGPAPSTGGPGAASIGLARARSVASSLDLRGARVDEALDALARYLDDASLAGLERVTIVHGLGTGALRDAVREAAVGHPLVSAVRAGERGEGGDGATIVSL